MTSGKLKSVQFRYSFPSDEANFVGKKFAQAEYKRDPWESMPLPTGYAAYGTTEELFARIKLAIAEQTHLSDKDSALLTLWVFSTWFHDVLSIAPGLVITGPAHDGDAVLHALYPFCYHPILVAGMTGAALSVIKWDKKPTLLIFEPNLSRRLAALLCSSTRRGYLALRTVSGAPRSAFDYYGPKAIYAGEDPPIRAMLQHSVHINASPAPGVYSQHVARMSEEMTQSLQNQLLRYRSEHLPEVSKLELYAAGLSPDFNAIASALGECIVDAPDLQDELVSLLDPYSEQQIAERIDDLGTLAVGAALALCHQGKDQVRVGEIAAEVNRIQKERSERLQYSAEKVGHRLKRAGLLTRRLGAAGNGLLMDHATQAQLHEVARAYGCVGLSNNKENQHCPICQQNK
jgi:DNA-binding IscR family transcriptional regulator